MRIGIIGAGKAARTIARHMLVNGHQIVIANSRGPDTLADVIADLCDGAEAGTREDVLKTDLVILSVNWPDVQKAVEGLNWNGQILIDATNAHIDTPPDISVEGVKRSRAALSDRTSSEVVSELTPGARLVKSISNIPMEWIRDFSPNKPRTVLFTSGDDQEAKRVVIDLLDSLGFKAIDLGSLAHGGALHDVGAPLSALSCTSLRPYDSYVGGGQTHCCCSFN